MARPMSLMIEGWMPSVGSSSTSSFGFMIRARAIASCCCWPPDRSPPRRCSIDFSTGNSSKISSGSRRSALASGAKPVSRFSRTLSSGKISRPCGTSAMPARARICGGVRARSVAVEQDAAGADRLVTGDGAQQGRLADAVAAEHAGDLAGRGGQRHATQGLRRAVVQVDGFDAQHVAWPLSRPSTRSSAPQQYARGLDGNGRATGARPVFVDFTSRDLPAAGGH